MIDPLKFIRSERGLSLVQVIIAIVITSMMGLFVMQMVLQMRKVEILMNLQSEVKDVERQVQRVLMDPVACLETIKPILTKTETDFPINTKDLPAIFGPPYQNVADPTKPFAVVSKGDKFAHEQISLDQINMVRFRSDLETPVPFPKQGVVTLFLELIFKKKDDKGLGGDYIKRWIPISVHTNKDRAVAACSSVDNKDLAKDMCDKLKLTLNPSTLECTLLMDSNVVKTACNALGLGSDGTKCQ